MTCHPASDDDRFLRPKGKEQGMATAASLCQCSEVPLSLGHCNDTAAFILFPNTITMSNATLVIHGNSSRG